VSDYTAAVAAGLAAAGDRVTVWTTPAEGESPGVEGVAVERRPGLWSRRGLAELGRSLDALPGPRRLLVQYTPMAWGLRGLNLRIGPWLLGRRRAGDEVWSVVHEVRMAFEWSDKPTRWPIAAASWWNARALVAASRRIFYTIPGWEPLLGRYGPGPGTAMGWLPVPSNVPVVDDPGAVERVRRRAAPGGGAIVGHFGTFGSHTGPLAGLLDRLLPGREGVVGLLIGRGARAFAESRPPEVSARLVAADGLPAGEVSAHLQACDLMVQPYIDGISTRRTTAMAALAHGRAVVTAAGHLSEPFWGGSGAVRLADRNEPGSLAEAAESLLGDPAACARLGESARALYETRFAVGHVVRALRHAGASAGPEPALSGPATIEERP
jgi:hypothetical protein